MIHIRRERPADVAAREALLDAAFGADRLLKTSQRLRDGRLPAPGLSFVATEAGRLVGTVRLWEISAGGRPALLLGPLAVAPEARNRGIGSALMRHALDHARQAGHTGVLLVGDAPYYGRFGFSSGETAGLRLPGPCEAERLLARELVPGALAGLHGAVRPTGRLARAPRRPAAVRGGFDVRLPRAA